MKKKYDVIMIGAGIMSATLAQLINELMPTLQIGIFERLDKIAIESSDAWNNAGTGHSAFCELNYTPEKEDGTIDISKAITIAANYEESKQFWSYLVDKKVLNKAENFINTVPHLSFVWGKENVSYLKNRYQCLIKNVLFEGMEYSENVAKLKKWMPLVMDGRKENTPMAATYMQKGTDVNFGSLTREIIKYLDDETENVDVFINHEIRNLNKQDDNTWEVIIEDLEDEDTHHIFADFIFIGAGGGTLPLLEKSDIEEAEGYGGFPISGQWLKCINKEVIEKHQTKVYGKAAIGSPPMSVPHLDTRIIDGKKELLFGPFAGFTTKFLKNGSYFDLPLSIEIDNILPMLSVGIHNIPLTKYLIEQVRQKPKDRLNALKEYLPTAKLQDWKLEIAGQRVQVIKKSEKARGVLEFGTEVVTASDGTIAALLGASPGASSSVSIMIKVLEKCFPKLMEMPKTKLKLTEMIPSYGKSLANDTTLLKTIRLKSKLTLGLKE